MHKILFTNGFFAKKNNRLRFARMEQASRGRQCAQFEKSPKHLSLSLILSPVHSAAEKKNGEGRGREGRPVWASGDEFLCWVPSSPRVWRGMFLLGAARREGTNIRHVQRCPFFS